MDTQKGFSGKMLSVALLLLCFFSTKMAAQKTVRYDLYVSDTTVNYTGKSRPAIAINGQIPAPKLEFTEGDTALIFVHNQMDEETSIHWHGILLPNMQDGVPYLTTAPIKPHTTHTFQFPIIQNGTYWYHSHTGLQEQSGMYGALILHKKQEPELREYTVVLSDWTNEKPYEVHRSLHNATDWYAIRKGSTQNYGEALLKGHLGTKLENEWKRMLAMDVSDVYYDRFLMNGQPVLKHYGWKPGEKVKLRLINGSASTYFWLNYGGGKLSVVANDGEDVEPVEVDRMVIAVAETYDVIVTVPADGQFEFRATAEDRTKFSSLWLGDGKQVPAPHLPKLKYFEGMKMMNDMMNMDGSMDDMGMNMSLQQMDMNTVMYPEITGGGDEMQGMDHENMNHEMPEPQDIVTLNYAMLRSPLPTTLPDGPTRTMRFRLTGNMNRYVWTIDDKTVSESDKILIKRGENVRIIMENASMMRHPMHLHGHFFRVLSGQGEHAPLKNVLDIMPMEVDTIEFHAGEAAGDWFFHCHILYHMMAGMGRIFRYDDTAPNPQLPDPKKALRKLYRDDREWHPMAHIGLESNGSDGEVMVHNTRYRISAEWRVGIMPEHGYETETHFTRFLDKQQFWNGYLGSDWRSRHEGGENTKDNRQVLCVGTQYMLPMFLLADLRLDHTGRLRFQVSREDLPLTNRLRFNGMWNSDLEYMFGFRYILTKYFSLSTHYDSDMKWGAGVTITY